MGNELSVQVPDEAKEAFWTIYRKNQKSWMLSMVLAGGGLSYFAWSKTVGHSEQKQKEYIEQFREERAAKAAKKAGGKLKTAVDKQFIADCKLLLKIAIPSFWSKEVLYMIVLAFFLVVRTILSIRIADVNGTIVKAIVRRRFWRV